MSVKYIEPDHIDIKISGEILNDLRDLLVRGNSHLITVNDMETLIESSLRDYIKKQYKKIHKENERMEREQLRRDEEHSLIYGDN